MNVKRLSELIFLILLPIFVVTSGCSTTESLTRKVLPESWARKILPGQPYLKRHVMVFPLIDQAGLGPELTAQLSHQFYDLLKKSPHLLLHEPPDGIFSSSSMESPQFGVVTNSSLIDFAEGLGMNDLIIGVLNPVEISTQNTGWWPFDDWRKIYGVSIAVNVVDIASKTLLLTNLGIEEFSMSLEDAEEQDEETYIQQISRETLPELIEEQAPIVEQGLNAKHWTGRISAVENNTIMINAGKDVGLQQGNRFEVFTEGKSIPSGSGRAIYLFGANIGELKVTSVMEKHSLAESVSGGPFKAKQFIRFKP